MYLTDMDATSSSLSSWSISSTKVPSRLANLLAFRLSLAFKAALLFFQLLFFGFPASSAGFCAVTSSSSSSGSGKGSLNHRQ